MSKSLDVLLVNVGSTKKKVYQDLNRDYSAIEPPFWAALTAGFLRKRGFSVDVLDASAENLTHNETAERIKDYNPKITNIVVYGQQPAASTQLMSGVSELCREIKAKNVRGKILLTGLHPSSLPEKTLGEEECDFVGEGEGFYTVLGLAQEKPLESIPGLWWNHNGGVRNNKRPNNIENLTEELGEVAWDLLPMDKYKAHNWQCLGDLDSRPRYASISTSLGCPFRCHFCSISATFGGEKRIRFWEPEWVIGQLEKLSNEYGVKNIKIIDEMFIFKPQHFLTIAEGLVNRKIDLNIWAYARVDTTKQEHLDLLKKGGFNWLCYGFEAGNEKVRQDVHKGKFGREDMVNVRGLVEKAGINVLGNYMFGLPEDDKESMQQTLELAKELNCEFGNFYCAMAYPGSELYKEAVARGWKLPNSWEGYSQHSYSCLPLPTNHLSAAEVLRFRDNAFDDYFKDSKYLTMVEGKFGKSAREHVENMTRVKLKRQLLGD